MFAKVVMIVRCPPNSFINVSSVALDQYWAKLFLLKYLQLKKVNISLFKRTLWNLSQSQTHVNKGRGLVHNQYIHGVRKRLHRYYCRRDFFAQIKLVSKRLGKYRLPQLHQMLS
jgi:hypothetical protein